MAKPILIVRFDQTLFTDENRAKLKETLSKQIEEDYHVLFMTSGSIENDVSFEVHGVPPAYNVPCEFGDLVTKIPGEDLNLIINRNQNRKRGEDPDKDNTKV